MFSTLRNAFKIKDIRQRLLYMVLILFIFRIGTMLPVPGVDPNIIAGNTTNFTLYSLIAGGNYGTIFAMGIGPYITSSIIMQLLTVAIPRLEQINKEGEEGRKRINQYTRIVTVALSLLQGLGQIYTIKSAGGFVNENLFVYLVALISMMTGTVFIMWLGERVTEKGIGNGASFIIFANILASGKMGVGTISNMATTGATGVIKAVLLVLILCAVMVFVIFVQDGERRIPVQYSKKMVGRKLLGGQSSSIPIKVNIAGVMSIIFSISLLQFPQTIYQLWPSNEVLGKIVELLNINKPVGAVLYVILIFCFTFFYTSFAFNPVEVAENIKKSGGFVPGIRPGKPTSDFIQAVVDRISLIGAFIYSFVALVPIVLGAVFKINLGIGGTTLLIVTGVALEIVKQLESKMLMRHYKGFLS